MGTGANGHLAIWRKWALEKMGTRKNERNCMGNWVTEANGYLGHLIGQTRTFEANGHRDE